MRSPSPTLSQRRQETQSRIQDLVSGRRPRHPKLSKQSTRRLILEAVVEEFKIYRLYQEDKARKAREESVRRHSMPSSSAERGDYCGRRRSRSNERDHGERRGRQQEREEVDNLVTGATNRSDPDPRFHMTGGAGPPGITIPHSPTRSPRPSRAGSHENDSSRSRHKQRFDSKGKPLIRGSRGWRDVPLGPAPKFKLKLGPTLGMGTHVKEKFQWGKEVYELEQKRKERRARGSLKDRKEERIKKRDDGKDRREKTRGRSRTRSGTRSRDPRARHHEDERRSQHSNRGPARREPIPDSYHRPRRESPESRSPSPFPRREHTPDSHRRLRPQSPERQSPNPDPRLSAPRSPNTEDKARAEAEARSRGERLARREARSRDGSASRPEDPAQLHFNGSSSSRPSEDSKPPERARPAQPQARRHSPPYPVYDDTPHSHDVEERERAEARQSKGM
ncbi:hypothetical protein K458DRAFT_130435 [Lentithecium fluviatile CBS 122367]|uniref:Uncharacterized protein n=1 Tax=Lentithecium fluviatile CBS 122367 TaxID=1168545 RepID=A0A6G1JGN8_9PLEO|nr:hypothetical protein K458DRAFT_130435 [Lentithecium fluviatile CBS 122367]